MGDDPSSSQSITKGSSHLTSYLKHVESEMKLQEDETKKWVKIMDDSVEHLIGQMKRVDKLFADCYRNICYTGSYYDGLRISSATEFDLNIVLHLPFKQGYRDVEEEENCPAFAKYRLKAPTTYLCKIRSVADFFDEENYLLPEKIRRWFQSVLDKTLLQCKEALHQYCRSRELPDIRRKESGPAITLVITTRDGTEINVDLVPVIEFGYLEWPKRAEKHIPIDSRTGVWYLVPKPYLKGSRPYEPKDEDVPRLWRIHFPHIERKLLLDLGQVKPLIKFLKKLRDEQQWKSLASYYLKTFVMWEIVKRKDEKWDGDLGEHFLELLRKLSKKIRERCIPFLFYTKYNLLHSMGPQEAENISNCLEKIRSTIKKDPRMVLDYLGCR